MGTATPTRPRDRAAERRAMAVYAQTHGILFSTGQSPFMPGAIVFLVGEHPRRMYHSAARAWGALRRLVSPTPPPRRRPSARLRGEVMGIKVVR